MAQNKPSIGEQLKSLGVPGIKGVKVGTADLPAPKRASRYEIDSVVAGAFCPTPLGDVFIAEQEYSADYRHGECLLTPLPFPLLAQWTADARIADLPLEKYAFVDTETSGLSGGTGTYAFLVGVGRFIHGQFVLQQFFMRDPAEEPALLEGLANFLAPCEALVTFNGKAFDAPLLRTRYSLHRIPVPFRNYSHLDLLPLARRLWRDRLPSRALKYLEEHVLGLKRTSEEVPGYEIPFLYFDYLRTRDARPLGGVFYHNAMDVAAMAALLTHISDMLANPYEGRVQHSLDFIALGKLFEDLGHWDEAARLYERGLESNLSRTLRQHFEEASPPGDEATGSTGRINEEARDDGSGQGLTESDFGVAVRRLSTLQKKRGDLDHALRLWQDAAEQGHIYAHIELAKYYEHKLRDAKSALEWTRRAQNLIEKMDIPKYVRAHWMGEIEHRLARLARKAGI